MGLQIFFSQHYLFGLFLISVTAIIELNFFMSKYLTQVQLLIFNQMFVVIASYIKI